MVLAGLSITRSRPHSVRNGNELKSTSVPHFRRNICPLQLRAVKWTSPRHFTHSLIRFTLAVRRTCMKQEKLRREEKPGSTRQN